MLLGECDLSPACDSLPTGLQAHIEVQGWLEVAADCPQCRLQRGGSRLVLTVDGGLQPSTLKSASNLHRGSCQNVTAVPMLYVVSGEWLRL